MTCAHSWHNFPETRHIDASTSARLVDEVASAGIAGGSVHDALIGLAARVHRLPLLSRDRRARPTCDRLGIEVHFLA